MASRDQPQAKSPSIPPDVRAEIIRLSAAPFFVSATKLGERFGISERSVQRIRADHKAGRDDHTPPPRLASLIDDPDVKPIVELCAPWLEGERTPEANAGAAIAFEQFFLRYSGFAYLPQHAREWVSAVFNNERLLLNVPPRHAKSEILTVWLSVFIVAMDRNVQILVLSQT